MNILIIAHLNLHMTTDALFLHISEHFSCSFYAYFMTFFGSYFIFSKALKAVISHITAKLSVMKLGCHHMLIGSLNGTVNSGHIKLLIGFLIVLGILQSLVQILIKVFFINGFIGVFSILNNLFKSAFYGPESCGSNKSFTSFLGESISLWISSMRLSSFASVSGVISILQISHNFE